MLRVPGNAAQQHSGAAPPPVKAARPKSFASAVRALQLEMDQVRQASSSPAQTFVFRPKAKILHKASPHEAENEPSKWRTICGWDYGSRTFLRNSSENEGSRRCKKCFDLAGDSSSDGGESSSGVSGLEDSSASSADELGVPQQAGHTNLSTIVADGQRRVKTRAQAAK
jgi:hypothetical protein